MITDCRAPPRTARPFREGGHPEGERALVGVGAGSYPGAAGRGRAR